MMMGNTISQFIIRFAAYFVSYFKMHKLYMCLNNIFCHPKDINITVLGFYNRANLGDESYKYAFKKVFGSNIKLHFFCTDDIDTLPPKTDVVICGGGDIINQYFMEKIHKIVKNYTGPIYAVSVGIPFTCDVHYLHTFDHVFVRSMSDYEAAIKEVGIKNVTFSYDICFALDVFNTCTTQPKLNMIHIGIFLAQPVFHAHPELYDEFCEFVISLLENNVNIQLHFFSFNTFIQNVNECDILTYQNILTRLPPKLLTRINMHSYVKTYVDMISLMQKMSLNICMRYHSIIFSLLVNVRFVPIFESRKIRNLLKDIGHNAYNIDLDQPINNLCNIIYTQVHDCLIDIDNSIPFHSIDKDIFKDIVIGMKLKCVPLTTITNHNISMCKRDVLFYLRDIIQEDELATTRSFPVPLNKDPLDIARIICYSITGQIDHQCIWGLCENMVKSDFNLNDAIDYIHSIKMTDNINPILSYCPSISTTERIFLNIDPCQHYVPSNVHRAGWDYVKMHLMNFNAASFNRDFNDTLMILDTYVDRTFHWGCSFFETINVIPYTSPWIGFVHHTFDETQSDYNCVMLLSNRSFLDSAIWCKGLIVLCKYLKGQLDVELGKIGINIPVHVLYHPTEFVEKVFTLDNFNKNKNKKIIQIGAWLRKPYSIYNMLLPDNCIIKKAVLKGKHMESNFAPPEFHEKFCDSSYLTVPVQSIIMPSMSRCTRNTNKYVQGLFDMIIYNNSSVEILEFAENDSYDELLSNNVVFLDLVDCSAVNTVIECVVRNTPLIVNRHPAIEEIVGKEYPGFYSNLHQASSMVQNTKIIASIYFYLVKLDKKKLEINTFLNEFLKIARTYTLASE